LANLLVAPRCIPTKRDFEWRAEQHEPQGTGLEIGDVIAGALSLHDGVIDDRQDPGAREAVSQKRDVPRAKPKLPRRFIRRLLLRMETT
jgi:hypothetical protein